MWQTPKVDWTPDDYYNPEDLNRVENNVVHVAQLIQQLIGVTIMLDAPTVDRDYSSIEFAEGLNRIEGNIQKLSVIDLPGLKPMKITWATGDPFSYKDAIRLESNTALLYEVLKKNLGTVSYCGTINCGEETI